LAVRVISMALVIYVVAMQLNLWRKVKKLGAKEKAHMFRVLLFALAAVMIYKNIVPLGVELIALISLGGVTLELASLSDSLIFQYFTHNAAGDVLMSVIIWLLYREAGRYK